MHSAYVGHHEQRPFLMDLQAHILLFNGSFPCHWTKQSLPVENKGELYETVAPKLWYACQ